MAAGNENALTCALLCKSRLRYAHRPKVCDSTALARPGGDWLGVVVYYDTGLNISYDMMLGSIYLSDQDTKTLHLKP